MIDERGRLERLIELSSFGLPYLIETWQDVLGIDATVWTTVLTAGGTITDPPDLTEEPYQKVILAGAATGDATRLYTISQWQLAPDTWGANTINKLLIMEWEARFDTVTDIDVGVANGFFMGLGAAILTQRGSNNIAGFILVGAPNPDLWTITDDAGAETLSAAAVLANANLGTWHKFKILAYNAIIEFWIDEVMVDRHITTDNLPDVNAHGQFYVMQNGAGGGGGELHVATVSIRPGAIL